MSIAFVCPALTAVSGGIRRSVRDSLHVLLEPVKGSGGQSIAGMTCSHGKQIDIRIGVFGKVLAAFVSGFFQSSPFT